MKGRLHTGSSSGASVAALALATGASPFTLGAFGCHLFVDTDHTVVAEAGAASGAGGAGASAGGGAGSGGGVAGAGGAGGRGGARCAADTVPPGTPVAIVTDPSLRPTALAQDSNYVYFISEAQSDAASDGAVLRVDKRGCKDPEPLAENLGRPVGLRAVGMGVFFTNDYGPANETGVLVVPKTGGAWTQIDVLGGGPLIGPNTTTDLLYSEAWDAGQPVGLHQHRNTPTRTDSCFVYQAAQSGSRITALAADATHQRFFAETNEGSGLSTVRRSSGPCPSVVSDVALDQPGVRGIDVFSNQLFWISVDSLFTIAKTAVPPQSPKLMAEVGGDLVSILALPEGLVVTNRDGTVSLIEPLPPHMVHEVAGGQGEPHGVIGDGATKSLYWTNRTSGQVMRKDQWAPTM